MAESPTPADPSAPIDPMSLDAAEQTGWDRTVDVVVVGLGAAGVAAAITAAEAGASVLALERRWQRWWHLGDVGRDPVPGRRHRDPARRRGDDDPS